jgi:hypothetical protein
VVGLRPPVNVALPLASAMVSFGFAGLVLEQWRRRRRAFQLVWSLGLLWYGLSTLAEALGSALGWNALLYRSWFLFGAVAVAAYLGMGTFYLLARARFGYFVGVLIALGGLFAWLSQLELIRQGEPAAWRHVVLVIVVAVLAGAAVIEATVVSPTLGAHVAMAILVVTSLIVAGLTFTAPIAGPGYALDPTTGVPVASAMPPYLQILPGPFNIAGAFSLVGGALFSAYAYLPKRRVLSGQLPLPILGGLYHALAATVNLILALPRAAADLAAGRLEPRVPATILIALGGFVPSITSGLDRFGITWALYLGQLLGVLLILAGFLVSTEVLAFRSRPSGAGSPPERATQRPQTG